MSTEKISLESSLPGLVEKLRGLSLLNKEEQTIFKEIVDSASFHAKEVSSHEMGHVSLDNAKPMSVHATAAMREKYINLGKELGLE